MVTEQVQIPDDLAQAVKRLEVERGVSIADIIREGVEALVRADGKPSKGELRRRTLLAIGIARGGPEDLAINHDKYLAEDFD